MCIFSAHLLTAAYKLHIAVSEGAVTARYSVEQRAKEQRFKENGSHSMEKERGRRANTMVMKNIKQLYIPGKERKRKQTQRLEPTSNPEHNSRSRPQTVYTKASGYIATVFHGTSSVVM